MSDKALMTRDEFLEDHSRITPADFYQCVKGTHPTLPPLQAVKKKPGSREPYLITREAALAFREAMHKA